MSTIHKHPADSLKEVYCQGFGMRTLVGVGRNNTFPMKYGNCTSLRMVDAPQPKNRDEAIQEICDDKVYVHIVNMYAENMDYLIDNKYVPWPWRCLILGEVWNRVIGVAHDERIPHDFYRDDFCNTCTPPWLLPVTQRLQQLRDIHRGDRKEHADGIIISGYKPFALSEQIKQAQQERKYAGS